MTFIAFLLVCLNPVDGVARERCDLVEDNSYFDDEGHEVFRQTIWWDFDRERSAYVVRAWRLQKNGQPLPEYDHRAGGWRCLWNDGDVSRCVLAKSYRRTWTQTGIDGDPEMQNRIAYPKELRRELTPAARPR